ncbi:hypothetical protein [Nocardioides sp.]|uniref:hypothetical protein n=1 Tax=Nocardioides sp. TaxID=35761 RepID=UPI002BD5D0D7|nr:hypothetical protein [Nocardioides sp.]HXH78656.1 hypothetical protein [Nocardioides sp.]
MMTGIAVAALAWAVVSWATRRRRDDRDLQFAQRDLGAAQPIAGVSGLGEAPVRTHHRLGTGGQRRHRW